jgi:tetratricopeptide (TPR) repeat protein
VLTTPHAPPRRRPLRAAIAVAFLLVFGVTLGVFLAQGIRLRTVAMDSITGDFLTGTGPGGVSPSLSFRRNAVERNLADGKAALERDDFRMAIDHFKSVLDVEPNNPAALSYLGLVLGRGGHADAGLEAIERALRTAPDYPFALWTKGLLLCGAKRDHAGAIQSWEALMRQPLAPADAEDVMLQGSELAGELTLIARLKRDGRAGAAVRGDLEGVGPGPVAVGTTDARITRELVR